MERNPQDPITELGALAASLHELFQEYVNAGFTEQQALYLIGQQVQAVAAASLNPAP
jgi:hypothetical protein